MSGALASATISVTASLNVTRCDHAATVLSTGQVLVAGGTSGLAHTSSQVDTPASAKWVSGVMQVPVTNGFSEG